jgi:recombinational DNA repair protein (RecF pathway)
MMRKHLTAVPACAGERRRCSRCGRTKPPTAFYRNPSTICKDCHNTASRFTNQCRRAAIAHLITAYSAEYRALLDAERASRHAAASERTSGGGPDVA